MEKKVSKSGKWIEAMRLRTIPVSIAGVMAGTACALILGGFSLIPAIICLLFAVTAQIASNFGNEYYDFKNGLDKKGRDGFRRGVTEGDIKPEQMKKATFVTLAIACLIGCVSIIYGGWWMIAVGVAVVIFALAYSAGPYPLSHHGMGDLAVVLFFGVVPVMLTCYLQTGSFNGWQITLPVSIAVGLMADNVLIVNNYRDMDDDKMVGKHTTVVLFGRRFMGIVYLGTGILAMILMYPIWQLLPGWVLIIPAIYLILHIVLWKQIISHRGAALNPLLGKTAMNLMILCVLLLIATGIESVI